MMASQVDFLLFQVEAPKNQAAELARVFSIFCSDSAFNLLFHRAARSIVNGQIYLYAKLPSPMTIGLEKCRDLQAIFEKVAGHIAIANSVRVSRLQFALQPQAISYKEIPKFHYVVETDMDEGWFDEIARWYDEEHMLGLATVPGCISAMRLINLDAKNEADDNRPLSFACYDLTSSDVLVSSPWLAVRHTAWSDIARPHFTNTLRTMMDVLEVDE